MTWEEEYGQPPGARRTTDGGKARQNLKTVVCKNCGFDTGHYPNHVEWFSKLLREKPYTPAFDIDFITTLFVIDVTETRPNVEEAYLTAIDKRRANEGEDKRLTRVTTKLDRKWGIVAAGNPETKIMWYKFVYPKVTEWKKVTFAEFKTLLNKAQENN